MPKFLERDRIRSVPGAFGVEAAEDRLHHRHDQWRDLVERTGPYKNCLYIDLDEEYGYMSWIWIYPGSIEDVVEDWKKGRVPLTAGKPKGEVFPLSWERWSEVPFGQRPAGQFFICDGEERIYLPFNHVEDFDGRAHVHVEEDTRLRIGYYELRGFREVEVVIHILDALAEID